MRTSIALPSLAALLFALVACGGETSRPTDTGAAPDVATADDVPAPPDDVLAAEDTPPAPDVVERPNRARLVRDEWGVPHVLAESDRACGYGLGLAMAEDQLPLLLRNVWAGQGRLTEIDGEVSRHIDRTMRQIRLVADIAERWDEQPAPVRDLMEGFAEGVNAYMAAHPDEVPAWAEPLEGPWLFGPARLLFLTNLIDEGNRNNPEIGPYMASPAFDGEEEFVNTVAERMPATGSNGWWLAPSRVEEGVGVHLGDPHMPWNAIWRTYESHLRCPSFEVAGAGFVGVPLPIFARNAHVAWTMTSNSPDGADTYLLELDPENPENYLYDGESVPFEYEETTFRLPDGTSVSERLRWSVHGPVTLHDPANGRALAYHMTGFGRIGGGAQLLAMFQARTMDELAAALAMLELPVFAIVAASSEGEGLFVWNGRVERRPEGVDMKNPNDGTKSALLPGPEDVVPFEELPQVRTPAVGYVQNCNNAPWHTTHTAADPGPEDQPANDYHGSDDTERAWRIRQMFGDGRTLTLAEARDFATEGRMISAPTMLPLLRQAWQTWGPEHPQVDTLAPAFDKLADWDGSTDPLDAAPTIYLLWAFAMWDSTFPPVEPLDWTLDDLDDELGRAMLDAMADGLAVLQDVAGITSAPWGFLHGINHGGQRFPVATGQYPTVSMMNCNVDPINDPELTCRIGSGYTIVNIMHDPIQSFSVTPLGQTDRTDRPYVNAHTALFAKRELKPLPFTDAEIAEHTASEVQLEME